MAKGLVLVVLDVLADPEFSGTNAALLRPIFGRRVLWTAGEYEDLELERYTADIFLKN